MADALRYYVAPDDSGFAETSAVWLAPAGYVEVAQTEYEERLAAQRAMGEQRAADAVAGIRGSTA